MLFLLATLVDSPPTQNACGLYPRVWYHILYLYDKNSSYLVARERFVKVLLWLFTQHQHAFVHKVCLHTCMCVCIYAYACLCVCAHTCTLQDGLLFIVLFKFIMHFTFIELSVLWLLCNGNVLIILCVYVLWVILRNMDQMHDVVLKNNNTLCRRQLV